MTEKEVLKEQIGAMCFAAYDVALFLDTHPFHGKALECFHYYNNTAKALKEEYQANYGVITMNDVSSSHCWNWIDGNWPWERED